MKFDMLLYSPYTLLISLSYLTTTTYASRSIKCTPLLVSTISGVICPTPKPKLAFSNAGCIFFRPKKPKSPPRLAEEQSLSVLANSSNVARNSLGLSGSMSDSMECNSRKSAIAFSFVSVMLDTRQEEGRREWMCLRNICNTRTSRGGSVSTLARLLLRNDGDASSSLLPSSIVLLGDVDVVDGSSEERFNILFLTTVADCGDADATSPPVVDDTDAAAVAATTAAATSAASTSPTIPSACDCDDEEILVCSAVGYSQRHSPVSR